MMARSYLIGPPGWGMDQRPSARREPRVMEYFFAEETMNLFFQRRSKWKPVMGHARAVLVDYLAHGSALSAQCFFDS